MKNLQFYVGTVMLACLIAFTTISCNKKDDKTPEKGSLQLNLSLNKGININDNGFKSSNLDEFTVNIYNSDNSLYLTYDQVVDVPETIELEVGSYYVEVTSNDLVPAAFESPFYTGYSEVFSVNANQTAEIDIECTLANIAVSVVYSQNVINDFDDYNTTVTSSNGSLVFTANETRMGYFEVSPLEIEAILEYQDALNNTLTKTLTAQITNPQPRHHYEIIVDISLDVAQGMLNITLNENVTTQTITLTESGDVGISAGDIIMTEFMADPDVIADSDGEWMEFYNTTLADIDIENYTVTRVGSTSKFTIGTSLIVPAGGFIVLAVSDLATDQMDYEYPGSFSLTNNNGQIQLATPQGTVISDITYGSGQVSAGQSAQLCPGYFNARDYNNMSNWTLSTTAYTADNNGTPGEANESCN